MRAGKDKEKDNPTTSPSSSPPSRRDEGGKGQGQPDDITILLSAVAQR